MKLIKYYHCCLSQVFFIKKLVSPDHHVEVQQHRPGLPTQHTHTPNPPNTPTHTPTKEKRKEGKGKGERGPAPHHTPHHNTSTHNPHSYHAPHPHHTQRERGKGKGKRGCLCVWSGYDMWYGCGL